MKASAHGALGAILSVLAACQPGGPRANQKGVVAGRPAVIPLMAGEKGWLDSSRFILLKVDPKLVGSEHFGLGSEDLPPRSAIPVHRHSDNESSSSFIAGTARSWSVTVPMTRGPVASSISHATRGSASRITVLIPSRC